MPFKYDRRVIAVLAVALALAGCGRARQPHNVILFVADGLRSEIVTPETAPALAEVRDQGVDFADSHSVYPTVTTVNASALATGHLPGDTGDFGNVLYVGAPFGFPINAQVAPVEDDDAIGLMNQRFGGDYLGETSLLQAARARGYSTAAIGKLGPTAVQDVTDRSGESIVVDDATGWRQVPGAGLPLPAGLKDAMAKAGVEAQARDRGLNASPGAFNMPGVKVPNSYQQDWFVDVATKVVLPRFKDSGRPFAMVFWSRDPDGTQHFEGDSLNSLTPGINGPTSLAAIRNASNDLQRLRDALKRLGLEKTTDIVVVADHGFSTASKQSATSPSAKIAFRDVPPGFLPPGFLAIDLAAATKLPLNDLNGLPIALEGHSAPAGAGALLGPDPKSPQVVVAANGGSDLIYLPGAGAKALARKVVDALTRQDYVGGLFVADALGPIPGTLPLSAIGLQGPARMPQPSIIVSFRSWTLGCAKPELCAIEVADTTYQQGQGMHGAFSRADTHNFMAAIGPDFQRRFKDPDPVGNVDVPVTLARALGLQLSARGTLTGRVLGEALKSGQPIPHGERTLRSAPAANGFVTVLDEQTAAGKTYFDAAGAPGRTFGLRP